MPRARCPASCSQDLPQLVGLDPRFVAAELKLVEALGKGTAITHHLEPSYFDAMAAAAAQVVGAQAAGTDPF